jgi:4-hydroxy-2-oxoglutarate aldolase
VALTLDEKAELVRVTRQVAIEQGRPNFTITLGCGGESTRDVITETRRASSAGADFAVVLVPSYFHFALTESAIFSFFEEVADASPIPIIVYNFPLVSAGIDLSSETLRCLGRHPNISGVKLTCGGIAKAARIRAAFLPEEFCTIPGQSDWILPAMSVGSVGAVRNVP